MRPRRSVAPLGALAALLLLVTSGLVGTPLPAAAETEHRRGPDPTEASVTAASVANRAHPETPGLQDFGDLSLSSPDATGYIRVDWFTPDGLPVWGDGRILIMGTDGYIELRKYVDIAGRDGKDHLLLVDRTGVEYIDCASEELPYGRAFLNDVRDRTETAMSQAQCFKAMELALTAQAIAEAGTGAAKPFPSQRAQAI